MKTRELFVKDPLKWKVENEGVSSNNSADQNTLRYELETFVCEGEYGVGLERMLRGFLDNLGGEQRGAWVSGFYGSGKSHLVKVLRYLWVDHKFDDGNTARSLATLPDEIQALLKELSTRGKQGAGLHAAGGTLKAGVGDVRLRVLGIILQSVGLPEKLSISRLMMDLRDEGKLEEVIAGIEAAKKDPETEFAKMYTSSVFQNAYLAANPHHGDARSAAQALRQQYPANVGEVSIADMLAVIRRAIGKNGKLPCTVIVLDEIQQYINNDPDISFAIQEVVEACQKGLDGQVFIVGTGQNALTDTPALQRIMGRFQIKVHLKDVDVEKVVRTVVLQKKPEKKDVIEQMVSTYSGEIARQLKSTKVATKPEDHKIYAADYPLLPVRQRFWEKVLHSIDPSGATSQMRTQLRVIHEACKELANRDVGSVIPGDFIYDQLAGDLVISGEMQRRYQEIIEEQKAKSDGDLRSRICALVFLINKLPREGADAGIRANEEHIADLLTDDLEKSAEQIRQKVPVVLKALVEDGVLMAMEDGEYRLQTTEGQSWEGEYRRRLTAWKNNDPNIASHRAQLLQKAINDELKNATILHGDARVSRKVNVNIGSEPPQDTDGINVWVRDGFTESESSIIQNIQARSTEDPMVHVLVPRAKADELKHAIAGAQAAEETINYKGNTTTPEGIEAKGAMKTRLSMEGGKLRTLVAEVLDGARVFLSGGAEAPSGVHLEATVKNACESVLDRLYPQFSKANSANWGTVWKRAKEGNANALQVVNHQGDPEKHPVAVSIMQFIGAGKRGTEVIGNFTSAPYGWPKDAVDGMLAVLLQSGHLSARQNGNTVALSEIDQKKTSQVEYRVQHPVLTVAQKLKVRKLYQEVGLDSKPGDEVNDASAFLQKLKDLAASAGGDAPAPLPPQPPILKELGANSGNDLLFMLFEKAAELEGHIGQWKATQQKIKARFPEFAVTRELLEFARVAGTAGVDEQAKALDAVNQHRSLLDDPDPVTPIRKTIGALLRTALQEAHGRYDHTLHTEAKALLAQPVWANLSPEGRHGFMTAHGAVPKDAPVTGTDAELASALRHCDLGSWRTLIHALPTRCQQALEAAIKDTQPKARKVDLPKATINNEEELDVWLEGARVTLKAALKEGPAII